MDKRPPARILIVDDEPVMLTITQSILGQHDFEVGTAESAEEALALIEGGYTPDLVLLDVLMPGINGFEACRLLRRQTHFEYLPIIMLTALDDQESIDMAYRCGATDFITKPLNIPLLPHRVRYLLRSSAAIRNVVESELALLNTQRIAHLGNWLMNRHGEVTTASRQYLEIVGHKTLPIGARQLIARVHPEDREALAANRLQLASGRPYQIDYRLLGRKAGDSLTYVHERGFPSFDGNGSYAGASGYIQDISERVIQEEKIRDLAWHDHLTGLNNRGRLTELIERELETERENLHLAMFFIHIANLPEISKILGQDQADLTVKTLASRLNGILSNPEMPHEGCAQCFDGNLTRAAKIGRYDEQAFVIAMPRGKDIEAMRCFAQLLQHSLTRPMVLHGQEFFFKVSIGIALYPQDAADASELMRRAMLVALNAAGREGHAAINFFDPQHDREASQRLALERGLRIALEQGGQLQPYFQPKISAETGEMIGAEVLLRWIHPKLGLISPAQFIPLAEEIGLIHPISEWLIAHVCEQIAGWRRQGREVGIISINLSADSFFQKSLTGYIDEVLARTGVPPGQLSIELTESVLMHDAEAASHVINSLRERGIRVSLDDFGTGFSSLGYLNRFAIDEIKIDRSFVVDLEVDTKERALVQAIITLGHALGLKVVAEGVETPRQAELLRTMGCDIFQGFLFARPMPAGDFENFRGYAAPAPSLPPAADGAQAG